MTDAVETVESLVTKEKLVADLRLVIADAEELLRATAHQADGKAAEMRQRIQENLSVARAKMLEAEATIRAKTREVAKATDTYVHENPWRSIGIAAGAGLLLGLLISRR